MHPNSENKILPFRVIVRLDSPAEPLVDGETPQDWVRRQLGNALPLPDHLAARPLFHQNAMIGFLHRLASNRDRAFDEIQQNVPNRLLCYAALDCAEFGSAQTLANALGGRAYLQAGAGASSATALVPRVGAPTHLAPTGDRAPCPISRFDQDYLNPAPLGVGARFAWDFTGGNGLGLRFVDIEKGWLLDHDDLLDARITLISGQIVPEERSHGTGVLGIIAALNNRKGPIGIAHGVGSARLVSTRLESDIDSTAEAIVTAILELRFGDVLLIEVQIDNGSVGHRPVEVEDAIFDAIRLLRLLASSLSYPPEMAAPREISTRRVF